MIQRRKMSISHHAKLRIAERVPDRLGYPSDEQMAIAARYKGRVLEGRRKTNLIKVMYKGFLFVYQYTANNQRLVTLYNEGEEAIENGN